MGKYLKKFDTHTEYEEARQNLILPNVSLCKQENEVHYNPWVETRLIGTFNVTSTSSATNIMGSSVKSQFSEIEIDGVVQPSVVNSYTFNTTGEHIVKYTLADNTSIGNNAFYNCQGLTSVNIPNSVISIDVFAFAECTNLVSIVCNATIAPTIFANTLRGVKTGGTLTVPAGSSGYDTWMGTNKYYLGYYNWTKVEQ